MPDPKTNLLIALGEDDGGATLTLDFVTRKGEGGKSSERRAIGMKMGRQSASKQGMARLASGIQEALAWVLSDEPDIYVTLARGVAKAAQEDDTEIDEPPPALGDASTEEGAADHQG